MQKTIADELPPQPRSDQGLTANAAPTDQLVDLHDVTGFRMADHLPGCIRHVGDEHQLDNPNDNVDHNQRDRDASR